MTDADSPFPEVVEVELTDVLDLHTIPPRDVRRVVEAYLREAQRRGWRSVRLIHGKGVGVQREIVRGVLARLAFVADFTDAPPSGGHWGATVAHLQVDEKSDNEQRKL
jgi:dsDNA-specific endonuclease/ATPase MutS2